MGLLLLPAEGHYLCDIKLIGCGSRAENYVVAGMILVAHVLGYGEGLPRLDRDTINPHRIRGSRTEKRYAVASAALNHLRLSYIQGLCGRSHAFDFSGFTLFYSPNVT